MEKETISKTNNVFTEKAHQMSHFKNFCINFGKALLKIILWLVDLVFSMFSSLWHFIKLLGIGIVKGVIQIGKFFKRKAHQFKYNDWSGRLSFVLFGASSFKHKQIVNGILYILFEIVYITMFIMNGIASIGMLKTLGSKIPGPDPDCMDEFCDFVQGDNSIMILIFGLIWVLSIIAFFYIWNRNINAGYNNFRIDNFVKFDELTKKSLEISEKLDEESKNALENKVRKSEFKKSKLEEINNFALTFDNKYQKDYTKYILINTIDHAYLSYKELAKLERKLTKKKEENEHKIARLTDSLNKKISCIEAKKVGSEDEDYLDKLNMKIENIKGKNNQKIRDLNKKSEDLSKKIYEFKKTYAYFGLMQNVKNNDKYGKFNDYYNVCLALSNEILFYSNYKEFKKVYNENLEKNKIANEENIKKGVELQENAKKKIDAIHEKYAEIREKRANIENEIVLENQKYKAFVKDCKEIKDINEKEVALLEAKAKLVEKTTELYGELHYLPALKSIKALEKEEIKEIKNSYSRDKKYLKTNFTSEGYAIEQVINLMLVKYKLEFKDAKYFANKLLNKKGEFLSDEEIASELDKYTCKKSEYEGAHPDKFVGRPRSFKESFDGLFNENFHITILALPVLGITLFTIIPLLFSILVAFTNYSVGHIPPTQLFTWAGFENFKNLFFPDSNSIYTVLPSALMRTLGWTICWAIIATFSNYILGIVVALLINKDGIKLKKLWRTIFILTIAIPQFISLLSIATLLKDSGAIGSLYQQLTGSRLGFGTDSSANGVLLAKFIIILVNVWVGIPYTILSTTGILLNIPKDLYESARVDGAGAFTQFTKITMPYILFVTGPYLITQFVGNINNFNVIYFLTGGGPAIAGSALLGLGQTDLLITFLYKIITSTNNPQFGIASSVGIFIFVICSFFSIVMYNKSGAIKEEDQFQ